MEKTWEDLEFTFFEVSPAWSVATLKGYGEGVASNSQGVVEPLFDFGFDPRDFSLWEVEDECVVDGVDWSAHKTTTWTLVLWVVPHRKQCKVCCIGCVGLRFFGTHFFEGVVVDSTGLVFFATEEDSFVARGRCQ